MKTTKKMVIVGICVTIGIICWQNYSTMATVERLLGFVDTNTVIKSLTIDNRILDEYNNDGITSIYIVKRHDVYGKIKETGHTAWLEDSNNNKLWLKVFECDQPYFTSQQKPYLLFCYRGTFFHMR